jgi:predicted dehydrogenase
LIASREIGDVFAVDLTFHNAYGPDKSWFYDRSLSGGGCIMDLGVHLIDLGLWALDFPKVVRVSSDLRSQGKSVKPEATTVEDYAAVTLELEGGIIIRIACSWRLQAGYDSIIDASFYGTHGGAAMRNINGSFYDFTTHRFNGTEREEIAPAADPWGGLAAVAWARQLATSHAFDADCKKLIYVANVIDRIYAPGTPCHND